MMNSQAALEIGPDGTPGAARVLTITVSDPKKESEGMNSYVSYKVNTSTNLEQFSYGQFGVIRRYSDFAWLSGRLARDVPGAIVPPLPDKAVVGRFGADFVEARRRQLERFLQGVAEHEELAGSHYFQIFLQADDAGLLAAKAEAKVRQRLAEPRRPSQSQVDGTLATRMGAWLEGSVASLSASMQASQTAGVPQTAEDEALDSELAHVANLEAQTQNVYKHAQTLAKRDRDVANGLFEFGLAFTLLGQTEHAPLDEALTRLGSCADQLSLLATEHVAREDAAFRDPVDDQIRHLASVKAALGQRQKHKHAVALAEADLTQRKQAAAKLTGRPGAEGRAVAAEGAIQRAREAVETAKQALEVVTARVTRELQRFKALRAAELRYAITGYCSLQAEHHAALQEEWAALLPGLEANSLPPAPPAEEAEI
jgi:sorting nexin-1/2